MNHAEEITDYFFEGKPVNLRISASPRSIKSIEFTARTPENRPGLPDNVKLLLEWFRDYSTGKSGNSYNIILLDKPDDQVTGMNNRSIILDTSMFTDKERMVYRELMQIKPGEVTSYGELASRCGISHGGRFIGNAMAKNRFPVIIPCHRVIKSDGSTGNFSGGVKIKEALLAHEAAGFGRLQQK